MRSLYPPCPLPNRRLVPVWLAALALLIAPLLSAQPVLVKDINSTPAFPQGLLPSNITRVNQTIYFAGDDGKNGVELWKSDGTEAGTVLVKDIYPGLAGSEPFNLTDVNGTLYFVAVHPLTGQELYKSDGTAAGTVRVKDIWPGPGSSDVAFLTNVNGTLYFAADDGTHGIELWKSNGTEPGTVLVKDIYPTSAENGGSDPEALTSFNGILYFTAHDPSSIRELWRSDGTPAGTYRVKDINPGGGGSFPSQLTVANGVLYFAADDGVSGTELWKTNGTAPGTVRVHDIKPGADGSSPWQLTVVGNVFFFVAYDNPGSYTLWVSNGTATGTHRVKAIQPGELVNFNGSLYFSVNTYPDSGLWKSDGTEGGTVRVSTISQPGNSSFIYQFMPVGTTLYFTASDGVRGDELWKTNGTAPGTALVKDIYPGYESSNPAYLTAFNNTLYFSARDPAEGLELMKTDGTAAGTRVVKRIPGGNSLDSTPRELTDVNGTLFFAATEGEFNRELWKSNGTAGGSTLVKDINPGEYGSDPLHLFNWNGALYFSAESGTSGRELWKSNGTAGGTVLVKDINAQSNSSSSPAEFTPFNGALYFSADDGTTGTELWKTNGTAPGTVRVKDINPAMHPENPQAGQGSNPSNFTPVNSLLFFTARDPEAGTELWKTDGTPGGTVRVKDIYPGSTNSSAPANLINLNGILYFTANSSSGLELWKSDGTAGGTVLVKDINPGPSSSQPTPWSDPRVERGLFVFNNALYFSADDGTTGTELWKSDGTAGGTMRVKDLSQGDNSSYPSAFATLNGSLFFMANGDLGDVNLWKSDGTAGGTVRIQRIPDGFGAGEAGLIPVNGRLYFASNIYLGQGRYAGEFWRSDGTTAGTELISDDLLYYDLTNVGSTFYFSYGELWKYDAAGCVEVDKSKPVAGSTVYKNQPGAITVASTQPGVSYQVVSGDSPLGDPQAGGGNLTFTIPVVSLSAGTNAFSVRGLGCARATLTQTATITVLDATAPPATTFRLNAGGGAFVASGSRAFSTDTYFTAGNPTTYAGGEVANTADDELYRSGRFGETFVYNLPTGNGSFDVTLHFAETYWGNGRSGGAGSRKFNVDMEGQRKLTEYDIFAKAGGAMRAVQETFRVTVTDGTLNVSFRKGSADLARVEAIEVVPATTTVFYRAVNLNGEAITLDGNSWAGKTAANYTTNGGSFLNTTTPLVPPTDATRASMIRSSVWRYTNLQLNLTAVPSGTYQVYLYVWEDNSPETYAISLEGKVVQANYNSGPGGTWKKLGPYQSSISDGTISLATSGGAANFSAVEVWKVNNAARLAADGNQAKDEEGQVSLYPNPVADELIVKLPFPAAEVKGTAVSDAAGKVRVVNGHRVTGQNHLLIPAAQLPKGFYLLRLHTRQGGRVVKFLKQ